MHLVHHLINIGNTLALRFLLKFPIPLSSEHSTAETQFLTVLDDGKLWKVELMKIFHLCSYISAAIPQQMTVLSTVFILDNMVHQNKWKLEYQKLIPLFADTYLHEIKVFLPKKTPTFGHKIPKLCSIT